MYIASGKSQPNGTHNKHSSRNLHSPRGKRAASVWVPNSPLAVNSEQLDAVIIRNLIYEAGRGTKKKTILNKINLTVPEGSIYGLLGPSGCGKTTMLRCIVGRARPRAGTVLVFGVRPGDGRGQVPGRNVGYMPQEISIYEDFTIQETLQYFGKINRMPPDDIRKRIEFLLQFLDLPNKRRPVANLSGGQKRRVSLAAALVHSPPLLILDEPTVGVDPLLRQNIWQHLVTMTKTERISVIITTHYIEEARLANVVGLMRNGRILAENSPDELMRSNRLTNLEDVFLKLCMSDSTSRRAAAARMASSTRHSSRRSRRRRQQHREIHTLDSGNNSKHRQPQQVVPIAHSSQSAGATVRINTATNKIELNGQPMGYVNEAVEVFSSEDDDDDDDQQDDDDYRLAVAGRQFDEQADESLASNYSNSRDSLDGADSYLAAQHIHWANRRANETSFWNQFDHHHHHHHHAAHRRPIIKSSTRRGASETNELIQWCKTLTAVTWKNYVRLRRNPPVLVFQFMLPAIQVILFCLCIGGEPFDVPVAIVNDELVPKSSVEFLNGLNRKIIRQIKYDNLSSAIKAVERGHVWGAIHIPDKYSENLQSRLIMGEEVTNETISNGTIRVYPDLTNLHLALTLETTFREAFINFARNNLEQMGYDKSLADSPIQIGQPVYGTLRKDGYLEFMAPGVVISISYVMATGLTALAFILERRDGLLERSLVSGVQTSQILLAHAINQVFVMIIQIFLVLGCTFFIFEIPSRGPFFWVVLLILLQGCTGMGFGLLVSAICAEENTAVMMVVGTFYTNLILAGIIWPIEAMPHWLRPVSYAQPQTLPTDTLRHILSRGWTISEPGVLLGFGVTIGWLVVFLVSAGVIFKYSR